jgi:hypothetical protein
LHKCLVKPAKKVTRNRVLKDLQEEADGSEHNSVILRTDLMKKLGMYGSKHNSVCFKNWPDLEMQAILSESPFIPVTSERLTKADLVRLHKNTWSGPGRP